MNIVEFLLEKGANVEQALNGEVCLTEGGQTPLFCASKVRFSFLVATFSSDLKKKL